MARELYLKQLGLGACHALLTTLHQDFVRLELLPRFSFTTLRGLTREGDLDRVLLLQTNSILPTLTNEGRMELGWNFEDFRSFIGLIRGE